MRGITVDGEVLTGQLVGVLRKRDGYLAFSNADIERFRSLGQRLVPETLNHWLRELNVLAITLRDHVHAGRAAQQLERELIDPLSAMLDTRQKV